MEQLVDGMDLDEEWCMSNLSGAEPEVLNLAKTLIFKKPSRIDEFSGNIVTCFVADRDEADRVRRIARAGFHS